MTTTCRVTGCNVTAPHWHQSAEMGGGFGGLIHMPGAETADRSGRDMTRKCCQPMCVEDYPHVHVDYVKRICEQCGGIFAHYSHCPKYKLGKLHIGDAPPRAMPQEPPAASAGNALHERYCGDCYERMSEPARYGKCQTRGYHVEGPRPIDKHVKITLPSDWMKRAESGGKKSAIDLEIQWDRDHFAGDQCITHTGPFGETYVIRVACDDHHEPTAPIDQPISNREVRALRFSAVGFAFLAGVSLVAVIGIAIAVAVRMSGGM